MGTTRSTQYIKNKNKNNNNNRNKWGNNNNGLVGSKEKKNQSAMPSNATELKPRKENHFLNVNNLPRKKEINCFEGMCLNGLCLMRILCLG